MAEPPVPFMPLTTLRPVSPLATTASFADSDAPLSYDSKIFLGVGILLTLVLVVLLVSRGFPTGRLRQREPYEEISTASSMVLRWPVR